MARLKDFYRQKVVPQLREELKLGNPMEVPRITKITVNMGVGEAVADRKVIDAAVADMTKITGQKPVVTRARLSVAGFKLREGQEIGAKVTLRGDRAWEFFDRLVTLSLPRVRDFRGVPTKSFDGRGNYTLGLKDQLVFPEIDYTRVDKIKGMNITLTTTAKNDDEGRELLKGLGFPLREKGAAQ